MFAETPIMLGTGLGVGWALKFCRAQFRQFQVKQEPPEDDCTCCTCDEDFSSEPTCECGEPVCETPPTVNQQPPSSDCQPFQPPPAFYQPPTSRCTYHPPPPPKPQIQIQPPHIQIQTKPRTRPSTPVPPSCKPETGNKPDVVIERDCDCLECQSFDYSQIQKECLKCEVEKKQRLEDLCKCQAGYNEREAKKNRESGNTLNG